ncbi:hypothetical protein [Streptomyces sp. NPDC056672]|uniref:hypothetical protein n=1 Tax=Streptomyces sp. NPDC056672 TaxID=3345906 RepID=UPI003699CB64
MGERGAALLGAGISREWPAARAAIGMPKEFRFYDLRHPGNLAADSGAKLKDLMVRGVQSSERAQPIYRHSTAAPAQAPAPMTQPSAAPHASRRASGTGSAGAARRLVLPTRLPTRCPVANLAPPEGHLWRAERRAGF